MKVFVGIFCAICVCFTLAMLFCQFYFPDTSGIDWSNRTREEYDEKGELVFLETRVDGLLQGRVFYKHQSGTFAGEFDSDVRVGKWEERYGNGAIRRQAQYSPLIATTNDYGLGSKRSDLIFQNDYDISGNLVGFVTNNFGVMVTMKDNGREVSSIHTVGCLTNATVKYEYDKVSGERRVWDISITTRKDGRECESTLFSCMIDACGKINYINEGRRSANTRRGQLIVDAYSEPPLFLIGKSTYIIPELIDAKPVFNQLISCTNATLVITPILGMDGAKPADPFDANDGKEVVLE